MAAHASVRFRRSKGSERSCPISRCNLKGAKLPSAFQRMFGDLSDDKALKRSAEEKKEKKDTKDTEREANDADKEPGKTGTKLKKDKENTATDADDEPSSKKQKTE